MAPIPEPPTLRGGPLGALCRRLRVAAMLVGCVGLVACARKNERSPPAADAGASSLYPSTGPVSSYSCTDSGADAGASMADAGAPCVPTRSVSYTRDVAPIFTACSGELCHNETWGGPRPVQNLVKVRSTECCDGRLLVNPKHPDQSYMLQKLRGVNLCAGQKMPASGTLSAASLETLTAWVCEGAPSE